MVYGVFSQKELDDAITVFKRGISSEQGSGLSESANKVAAFLKDVLDGMKKSGEPTCALINRDECIGSILWVEDDVKSALTDEGYEDSGENVDEVLSKLIIKDLENCESGWDAISDAIGKAKGNLKKAVSKGIEK